MLFPKSVPANLRDPPTSSYTLARHATRLCARVSHQCRRPSAALPRLPHTTTTDSIPRRTPTVLRLQLAPIYWSFCTRPASLSFLLNLCVSMLSCLHESFPQDRP
ncbi:hypothetical protein B0H19DRAFT_1277760 [Mycena capillaripes]|nr:hypothetical protein B0H19DRAFT_1277760 [Mycena capillaripes]